MNLATRTPRRCLCGRAILLYGSAAASRGREPSPGNPRLEAAAWFAEIEPFPSAAVLSPTAIPAPNLGDNMTAIARCGARRHGAGARHPGRRHAVPVVQRGRCAPWADDPRGVP